MKKNLLLLAATILILLILGEITARIWTHFKPLPTYTDIGGYSYYPYLPYSPTPNYREEDNIRVHNSRGFRNSYNIEVPKPPSVYRIICLGGSSTYDDYGKQPNELIWTGRLEYYLNRNSKGKKYEVVNAGAHNYTANMNLIDYMTRCRDLQPDAVIIYEGFNEMYFNGFDSANFAHANVFRSFDYNYQHYYNTVNHNPFLRYSTLLRFLYIKFYIYPLNLNIMSTRYVHSFDSHSLENISRDSLYTYKKALEGFVSLSPVDNFKLIFLSQAYNYDNMKRTLEQVDSSSGGADSKKGAERLNMFTRESHRVMEMMRTIAAKYGVPYLDMNVVLNQNGKYFPDTYDPVHFSKEGSDFFARQVSEFLIRQKLVQAE